MSKVIYAEPDMNKKVKFDRGEMEERIVDIFVSADTLKECETSTKREETADTAPNNGPGDQHSEPDRSGKRPFLVVAVCLGLLCVPLAWIIGLSVYYNRAIKDSEDERYTLFQSFSFYKTNASAERDQLQTKYNNLTEERDQLQTKCNNLTEERDQLQTRYNNLTEERDQLQTKYNNLTEERDQLQTRYNNLTEDRDQLQTTYNNLTEERDQLQTRYNNLTTEKDRLQNLFCEKTCSDGWKKCECSCYFISPEKNTWEESRQDCLERGTDLVIINSREEQEFLFNFKKRVWIGLTDRETEETWKWVDGTPLTTEYWYDPQPDNGGGYAEHGEGHYAEINKVHLHLEAWNYLSCDKKINWTCEKVI